ncbi:D-alanyl-lipoteichoic acid acyltransferase DltB, MBOAT superfamily [Aquimarina amphilecti]|uniref:D-alanyl-lipoteichoic acid acyltransferase DltB, MBOAT superfamily n=1 Tax=Aquimarina amphilecti TaxID=1038014 RepID=A0A1H7SZD8_AQUAM|nr:MBOAT family O-acyltransferase [Aquimarina amphilecti]SEL77828.1 D-alanyl-lipoteichoic acid acyltransferase DltB, MBOAT superfamily [Aquimarina amphilecti]
MNRLKDIFSFSEDYPLIFTQADFWIFFAVIYFLYAILYSKKNLRSAYLFAISLLFYYKTSGLFIGILLFSTVNDFFLGKAIYNSTSILTKKLLVTVSVIINLGTLCYFKYAYFFTESYNNLFNTDYQVINYLAQFANSWASVDYFTVDAIILPVGISFYTFQTISYSVDIYRKQIKPLKSIIDFGFFVSFFPQLVAGPIVRAADFVPQIRKEIRVTKEDFGSATFMILKGLIKKMLFADFIAMNFMDRVFDVPEMFSGFTNIMAMIGYSLQIYGDFSGYTDIAIGLALLMGYKLPVNFDSPYKAIHCGDFWKRWHISLSSWLKDYLYIPIGGNRNGSIFSYVFITVFTFLGVFAYVDFGVAIIATAGIGLLLIVTLFSSKLAWHFNRNVNIMITMLIGGLWHGASWKFVIWGGLNGLGVVAYKYWRKISPYENSNSWLAITWKIAFTFIFITFTRIYFRGNSMDHINRFYQAIMTNMDWTNALVVLWEYRIVFVVMLFGYITHWLPYRTKDWLLDQFIKSNIIIKGLIAVIVAIICYQTYAADFQPFIYFQF